MKSMVLLKKFSPTALTAVLCIVLIGVISHPLKSFIIRAYAEMIDAETRDPVMESRIIEFKTDAHSQKIMIKRFGQMYDAGVICKINDTGFNEASMIHEGSKETMTMENKSVKIVKIKSETSASTGDVLKYIQSKQDLDNNCKIIKSNDFVYLISVPDPAALPAPIPSAPIVIPTVISAAPSTVAGEATSSPQTITKSAVKEVPPQAVEETSTTTTDQVPEQTVEEPSVQITDHASTTTPEKTSTTTADQASGPSTEETK